MNGTDRWYTQGARISYLQADNQLPGWAQQTLEAVPELGFSSGAERIGYEVGQDMFTAADTHSSQQQLNDRPFAGWLYGGLILQRRGLGLGHALTLENFELQLGIVGPESLAGQMQTWYHHHAPPGWKYQIRDEPGLALRYERSWLLSLPNQEERHVDLIPQAGLSVGNVDTSFRVATTLRAGWHLPDDVGPQPIDSLTSTSGGWSASQEGRHWSVYVFSGVEGRAQLYTVFLDGNSFRESARIDKEPFVGEWRSGLAVVFDRFEVAYTHCLRTREFEGQPEGEIYGSLTLRFLF